MAEYFIKPERSSYIKQINGKHMAQVISHLNIVHSNNGQKIFSELGTRMFEHEHGYEAFEVLNSIIWGRTRGVF